MPERAARTTAHKLTVVRRLGHINQLRLRDFELIPNDTRVLAMADNTSYQRLAITNMYIELHPTGRRLKLDSESRVALPPDALVDFYASLPRGMADVVDPLNTSSSNAGSEGKRRRVSGSQRRGRASRLAGRTG